MNDTTTSLPSPELPSAERARELLLGFEGGAMLREMQDKDAPMCSDTALLLRDQIEMRALLVNLLPAFQWAIRELEDANDGNYQWLDARDRWLPLLRTLAARSRR